MVNLGLICLQAKEKKSHINRWSHTHTHTHTKGGRERLERLIFFERFRKKEKEKKELVKHTQKKKNCDPHYPPSLKKESKKQEMTKIINSFHSTQPTTINPREWHHHQLSCQPPSNALSNSRNLLLQPKIAHR